MESSVSLESWTARYARDPWGESQWNLTHYQPLFIRRIVQLGEHPDAARDADRARILDNLSHDGGFVIGDESLPLSDRMAVLDAMAVLVLRLGPGLPVAENAFMFWDAAFVMEASLHTIRGHAFELLKAQLDSPDLDMQLGALHGLNHLRHPETPKYIESILPRLADESVRDYARSAATMTLV